MLATHPAFQGPANKQSGLWRYMRYSYFMDLLTNERFRISAATQFDTTDKYECMIPKYLFSKLTYDATMNAALELHASPEYKQADHRTRNNMGRAFGHRQHTFGKAEIAEIIKKQNLFKK
jgi:hypothetical protein